MTLLWPAMLGLLLIVPALLAAYVWSVRRRQRFTLRYSSLSLLKEAAGPASRVRRHVPPALFLLSMTGMLLALARPVMELKTPHNDSTVILTIDVSRSMSAEDVTPNRLQAARVAAREFVDELPEGIRVGIVAFGASAVLVQAPTEDKDAAIAAINRLQLQSSTAIGEGLLAAIKAFYPNIEPDPSGQQARDEQPEEAMGLYRGQRPSSIPNLPPLAAPGIVVLLSDGQNRTGIEPMKVAPVAKELEIHVYTVGVGTPQGAPISGPNGGRGGRMRGALDEATLKQMAEATEGEYFNAQTATDLSKIYTDLGRSLVLRTERTELTAYLTAASTLLAVIGGVLSLLWFNRLP